MQTFNNTEPTAMEHLRLAAMTSILTGQGLFSSLGKAPFVLKWMLQFTCYLFLHSGFLANICSSTSLTVVEEAVKAILFKTYTDIS